MTDRPARTMLHRLHAVDWVGDWDISFRHVMSRRLLMREYLRRAALWARHYSAEREWPFFDATEYAHPGFRLSPELASDLEELLRKVPGSSLRTTCAGAVRMAELRNGKPSALPDLPDLYEPLVLFYERGGEFVQDDAGALDLTGVSFRPGTPQGNLQTPAFLALSDAVLDAVDAAGRISYYAPSSGQGPLLRRRLVRGERYDEEFGDDLRWSATGRLPDTEEAIAAAGLVPVGEIAAAGLIGSVVEGRRNSGTSIGHTTEQ
ncbi:hypothetical protein [Streptomyces sp. NPDC015131]|uniref:hypothetical protein n=1 Tax=Streptomyces sp. NPDC015131 TaxID=3364941 RepID=UPI003700C708